MEVINLNFSYTDEVNVTIKNIKSKGIFNVKGCFNGWTTLKASQNPMVYRGRLEMEFSGILYDWTNNICIVYGRNCLKLKLKKKIRGIVSNVKIFLL